MPLVLPAPPVAPTVVPMADPGSYLLNWPVGSGVAGYAISFRPVNNVPYEPFDLSGPIWLEMSF